MTSLWDQDLETGVLFIDVDHRALVRNLASLRAAVESGQDGPRVQALLQRFRRETRTHFDAEECEMWKSSYPMSSSHIAQHAKFIEEVDGLLTRHCQEGEPVTASTVEFLETWFVRHLEIADKPLADWLLGGSGLETA